MYFGDSTFVLLLPALFLALFAQGKVRATYRRYAQVMASSRISAAEQDRRDTA